MTEDALETCDDAGHKPVLAEQVIDLLQPQPGMVCVDCTAGRGGHAELLAKAIAPGGRLIGLDLDPQNLAFTRHRLADAAVPIELIHANFATLGSVLGSLGLDGADLILADLGFSSNQIDDAKRGFSFQHDGPLDMRLDPRLKTTAGDLVNDLPEKELADLIYQYGEERLSRKIARKIVEQRAQAPIVTTSGLSGVVRRAYGPRARRQRINPSTRTFMALRIAVNGEMDALGQLLEALPALLRPGGAACVISFQSLEDRQVKHAFMHLHRTGMAQRLTVKPVVADESERRDNPRSRSAKLRAIRMIDPAPEAAANTQGRVTC
jgi:16S rRNA (cytosine1402-N4)-methyltransferase